MNFTQYIDADNLSNELIAYIKSVFKGKRIRLTIESEPDDTAYLMASEANHQRLIKSIQNVKKRQKLITVSPKELKKLAS